MNRAKIMYNHSLDSVTISCGELRVGDLVHHRMLGLGDVTAIFVGPHVHVKYRGESESLRIYTPRDMELFQKRGQHNWHLLDATLRTRRADGHVAVLEYELIQQRALIYERPFYFTPKKRLRFSLYSGRAFTLHPAGLGTVRNGHSVVRLFVDFNDPNCIKQRAAFWRVVARRLGM